MMANQALDQVAMTAKERVMANSLEFTVEDATTTKGSRNSAVKVDANSLENEGEKVSIARSERNILEMLSRLINENTAQIAGLFSRQILHAVFEERKALKKANRVKEANVITKMVHNFANLESGANFVEFKKNVKALRETCTALYVRQMDERKAVRDEIKDIQGKISALRSLCSEDESFTPILGVKIKSLQNKILELQRKLNA